MTVRGPSAWLVAAFAAAAGAAIGGGQAAIEAALRPWRIGDFGPASLAATPAAAPVAEVPETRHEFGTVGAGAEGSHEFVIRNTGKVPLVLTRGATSCSCTVSDFESSEGGDELARKEVPPGEATRVRLKWRGKGAGGPFRQQATVFTNDPQRPEIAFVIEGTVVPTWKAVPDAITLPTIATGAGAQATVKLFTYGAEPPLVEELAAGDPQTAQSFMLASAPLAAAEIAAETGATGGLEIGLRVAPGLPIGQVRQTIKARLRMPEEIIVEIPVQGTVSGALALAGGAWDSSRQALLLGTVSGRAGSRTEVFLTAKGPHAASVKPVVREVVPDSLAVEIGDGKPVGDKGMIRIPLTITIRPGSPPANHRCSDQGPAGRIVLETGHPETPEFSIPVCVVIGP
ncbi:MAG: DUF1573 domain-containing protein [Planctomycetia bacterium]